MDEGNGMDGWMEGESGNGGEDLYSGMEKKEIFF